MILAVDPALRHTGVCLLAGAQTRLWTLRHRGDRDGYTAVVRRFVETGLGPLIPRYVVVEYPPPTYGRGRTKQSALLGYTSGVWCGVAEAILGDPSRARQSLGRMGSDATWASIQTVDVALWRRIILGPDARGDKEAEALADIRARAELAELGAELPADDHQAEAYCIARWWEVTIRE